MVGFFIPSFLLSLASHLLLLLLRFRANGSFGVVVTNEPLYIYGPLQYMNQFQETHCTHGYLSLYAALAKKPSLP